MNQSTRSPLHLGVPVLSPEAERELDELAKEDPIMAKARDVLAELSQDPKVIAMARERESNRRLNLALLNEQLAQAEAKGEAKGRAQAEAEGRAKGRAEAILLVLAARGLTIEPAQRERILGTTGLNTLMLWLEASMTAASVAEVLEIAL